VPPPPLKLAILIGEWASLIGGHPALWHRPGGKAATWADTTTSHGRLTLTVLGGLAEFERELIRARTGEGRKRAQARGVKFGRPPKLNAHQRKEAIARMRNGETQADIARTYGVDATTIGRMDCSAA